MYFLNYVDRNAIAQARLNNLEDDLGMTGVQFNTTVSMLVKVQTWAIERLVELTCFQPLRGLCANADSVEYAHHSDQTWDIHEHVDAHLGCSVRLYWFGSELCWYGRLPLHVGRYGSSSKNKRCIPAIMV